MTDWYRPGEYLPREYSNVLFIIYSTLGGIPIMLCGYYYRGIFTTKYCDYRRFEILAWRYAPSMPDWLD